MSEESVTIVLDCIEFVEAAERAAEACEAAAAALDEFEAASERFEAMLGGTTT